MPRSRKPATTAILTLSSVYRGTYTSLLSLLVANPDDVKAFGLMVQARDNYLSAVADEISEPADDAPTTEATAPTTETAPTTTEPVTEPVTEPELPLTDKEQEYLATDAFEEANEEAKRNNKRNR